MKCIKVKRLYKEARKRRKFLRYTIIIDMSTVGVTTDMLEKAFFGSGTK